MNRTDIRTWHVAGKQVFVRIDGNVLIENGIIQDDFRLKAVLPTLELLKEKGAQLTIATHLGRPDGKDPAFSTKPLKQWFMQQGFAAAEVLENLRSNAGEKNNDLAFAKELAHNMDFYVNDAWGLLHRREASTVQMPQLFQEDRRAFGLLVHKELEMLTPLKDHPKQPYVVIIGGGKPETKIPLLERLIRERKPTTVIVLPALSFTFLKALGKPVGASLVVKEMMASAQATLILAQEHGIELLLPVDYTYFEHSWDGALRTCMAQEFPAHGIGIGVGPESLKLFERAIMAAHTIFFNGAMGMPSRPESMRATQQMLRMIANSPAYSVIGGGSSIAEVAKMGLFNDIDYYSTGGGATLAYISDEAMPGLDAM